MEIRTATKGDIPTLSAVLAGVFAKDPPIVDIFGLETPDRDKAIRSFFAVQLEELFVPHGRVDVAYEAGKILGVAAWQAPGSKPGRIANLRMNFRLSRVFGRSVRHAARNEAEFTRHHPRFPHWYLGLIGVVDSAQGTGVGGRLLDYGLERAGEHAAYLESSTPRSQRLYERKGFIALGTVGKGKPWACVGMWRPGRVTR